MAELTVRVEIMERGPMVGLKSDEKARLNDAHDTLLFSRLRRAAGPLGAPVFLSQAKKKTP
jgi:hypothetical protein